MLVVGYLANVCSAQVRPWVRLGLQTLGIMLWTSRKDREHHDAMQSCSNQVSHNYSCYLTIADLASLQTCKQRNTEKACRVGR